MTPFRGMTMSIEHNWIDGGKGMKQAVMEQLQALGDGASLFVAAVAALLA